jgi:hypothetical protein
VSLLRRMHASSAALVALSAWFVAAIVAIPILTG